jgi:hypothetical protein
MVSPPPYLSPLSVGPLFAPKKKKKIGELARGAGGAANLVRSVHFQEKNQINKNLKFNLKRYFAKRYSVMPKNTIDLRKKSNMSSS